MNRDGKPSKVTEWILVSSTGIAFLLLMTAVFVFALSGNPVFVFLSWSLLGLCVSVALQVIVHRLTSNRRSYWMLIAPLYFVVLLSAVFLFFYSPELMLESFGALGFYATFFTSLGAAKNIFSPRSPEENL